MDEIIILKNNEIIENDLNYFYQKVLDEYPKLDFGIIIKELKEKKDEIDKKEYDKDKLLKKKFLKSVQIIPEIENYDFYLENKKIIIQINNIKNHIDFLNIKYPSYNINFKNLSTKKIENILLIKYLEDYIKYFIHKKIIGIKKKYTFKECLSFNNEFSFNVSLLMDNRTKIITTPFYNENNERIEPNSIKKNNSLNLLIELNKIWVNKDKKTFGINWVVVQGLKNDDLFTKNCFLNPNGNTTIKNNNYPNFNYSNKNNFNNIPPPPPPINKEAPIPLKLNINLNELKQMKNKITGSELDN
jgi:hypothetical protein